MHYGELGRADDTNSKAEEPDMVHGSREHAERTDIQMFSVLHPPLLLMEARECPGCAGYSHSTRYVAAHRDGITSREGAAENSQRNEDQSRTAARIQPQWTCPKDL